MKSKLLLTGLIAAVLSACGGGGDGGSTTGAATGGTGGNGGTVQTTKITGTAAIGAAIPNALVEVKCKAGSAKATTNINGFFTADIANLQTPCVLSAPAPDGTTLHSLVETGASGSILTANISPLTELVLAALAQGETTKFFQQFDANAQLRLSPAQLTAAIAAIRQVFDQRIDLTGIDPVKGQLLAAIGGVGGNAMDKMLDQLAALLTAANIKLADLSGAMAANAGAAAIQTVLKPASATCNGLRHGVYFLAGQGGSGYANFDSTGNTYAQLDGQADWLALPT
ncbi:hypothetical protein [Cupriavidus sp. SW-Y-13]|uniref:hypothetical protein n=1 Tax=Cupriavidus sp. SW-Y-13 TaxID=2653854 RepID=UPI001F46DB69|nr:hypothetical protein [Cupriavidus sp. SW-Y-13]